MADFLRPEALAVLKRWSEPILAAGLGALGLWWALTSWGVLMWIGWILVAIAVAWGFVSLQRLRFARGGGGAGVVTVDERRVIYMGPVDGGVAELDLLVMLELVDGRIWRLVLSPGGPLDIPVDAEGADALFDVFAALPGLRAEALLSALKEARPGAVQLWTPPGVQVIRRPVPLRLKQD